MKKIQKAQRQYRIATFFFVLSISIFISFLIYLVYPIKIYENNKGYMRVLNKTIKAGDVLQYESDFCKFKNYPSHIDKTLVNHILIYFEQYGSNYPIGCHKVIINTVIPEFTPPGTYFIRTIIHYDINRIKRESYTIESEQFTIIE